MSIDLKWMSNGGVLMQDGDLALVSTETEGQIDMIKTRVKADLNGWKLYQIGADLEARLGEVVDAELEIAIKKQIVRSLTKEFLPANAFKVKTLAVGSTIEIFIFQGDSLAVTASISRVGNDIKLNEVK
jgi:hypothetical protein